MQNAALQRNGCKLRQANSSLAASLRCPLLRAGLSTPSLARHQGAHRHLAGRTKVVETSRDVERGAWGTQEPPRGLSPQPAPQPQQSSVGFLALFGVAVLWGSYTPAIRLLYQIETPPDPALLNALQACLSAAFLVAANITAQLTGAPTNPHPERSNPLMAEDSAFREATIRRDRQGKRSRSDAGYIAPVQPDPPRRAPSNAVEHALASALNWRSTNLTLAGAEVGLWMCLAFGLEVAGLQLTSATKVAFLNQVSVLITPLLVHLSGERVRGIEWLACGMGLLGSILVAADSLMNGGGGGHGGHGGMAADGPGNEVLGLIFVLVSAMFFALSTVRLGRYSSRFDPLQLSTTSTTTLGLLSLTWVLISVLGRTEGPLYELTVIENMLSSTSCVLTLLWVGLGPGALAAYLQAIGQSQVPPAQAQVIYSTTPLWAAGFAFVALDASDEAMGGIAWVGAAVMLGSSLLTALQPPNPQALSPINSLDSFDDLSDTEFDMRDMPIMPMRAGSPFDGIDPEIRERQGLRDLT